MTQWQRSTKIVYTPRGTRKYRRGSSRAVLIALGAVIACVALAYGVYRLLLWEKIFISSVEIGGIQKISESDIRSAVNAYLGETVLGFIPRKEYFFLSGSALSAELRELFPEIRSLVIDKKFPDHLSINIEERSPWGIVCGRTAPVDAESGNVPCAYVDTEGYAFDQAPVLIGSLTKKIFTDRNDIAIGSAAVSPNVIREYDELKALYEAMSLPLTHISLSVDSPRDMRVYSNEWYGITDIAIDIDRLKGVFEPLFRNELSGKIDRLEYVDLRFGNKIFYKLRGAQ